MDFSVYVTSAATSSERKVSPQWSMDYLKQRLEHITGIAPEFQCILYYPNPSLNEKVELKDARNVGELGITPYSRLHVVDTNPESTIPDMLDESSAADYEYKMSEDEYKARLNTVLEWKRQQQLGRFDPEYQRMKQEQEEQNASRAKVITVGARCRVINISSERRGVVKFVGRIEALDNGESEWVGIEFDEPVGKNSGNIAGLRVFECRQNHGSFVRPKQVEVGDFPEVDPFESEEEL